MYDPKSAHAEEFIDHREILDSLAYADGKSHIDEEKCIKCGKCLEACPYNAIVDKGQIYQTIMALHASHYGSIVAVVNS